MDKAKVKEINDRLSEAIVLIEQEFNIKLVKSRATYDDTFAKYSYEFNEVSLGKSGVNESSPQAIDYVRWSKTYGLNLGMLGTPIKSKSGTHLFAGINVTRPKYFVALANDDGTPYGATTLRALTRDFFVSDEAFAEARKGI